MLKPLVSAVVVTHNNKEWLGKSLPALFSQTHSSLEVLVVDNASSNGTADYVTGSFPKAVLIQRHVNDGFGRGINAGIVSAKGKYLFIGNDDLVLDRNYIRRLVAVMEQDSSIGACQGSMYSFAHRSVVESAGKLFNYSGILVGDEKWASLSNPPPVEIFYANAPLLRREVLERIGGFDEDYFLYFEEADLCWRMWLAGYRVVYVSGAWMYHAGGVTARAMSSSVILEQSLRNRINSYIKNSGFRTLVISLVTQLLINSCGAFLFAIRGDFRRSMAIFRAWIWNIWQLPHTIAKRKRIQNARVIADKALFSRIGAGLPLKHLLGMTGVGKL